MGDSLSWAYDQERDAYFKSEQHKKDKALAEEWNNVLESVLRSPSRYLNVSDLVFILQCKVVHVDSYPIQLPRFVARDLEKLRAIQWKVAESAAGDL
jgi:hypothetical protein